MGVNGSHLLTWGEVKGHNGVGAKPALVLNPVSCGGEQPTSPYLNTLLPEFLACRVVGSIIGAKYYFDTLILESIIWIPPFLLFFPVDVQDDRDLPAAARNQQGKGRFGGFLCVSRVLWGRLRAGWMVWAMLGILALASGTSQSVLFHAACWEAKEETGEVSLTLSPQKLH